jgi:cell division protein FtsB
MINLMPDTNKQEIRAARMNVILGRYIIVILLAFAFLALLLAGSYVVLSQNKASAERLIQVNSTKADAYSSTKAQVDALSASLSATKSILDQEILYWSTNATRNSAQKYFTRRCFFHRYTRYTKSLR